MAEGRHEPKPVGRWGVVRRDRSAGDDIDGQIIASRSARRS